MDSRLSTTFLPGIWVIETLARSNQIVVSLLLDLLEKFPQTSDDIGRNARELVSFRILESLLFQGAHSNSLTTSSSPKIAFDQSKSCEDVLQQILLETPASNLKTDGPEMWRWDVQSFIAHKRFTLDNHTLQQLKGAILTRSHSFLESLVERSGLPFEHQPKSGFPVNGDKRNGIMTDSNTCVSEGSDELISPAVTDSNFLLHSDRPNKNLLPVKEKKSATIKVSNGKPGKNKIISKKGNKDHTELSNKYENDIIHCDQDLCEKLSSSVVNKDLVDAAMMIGQYRKTERRGLKRSTNVQETGPIGPQDDDDDNGYTSLKEIGGACEVLHCTKSSPHCDTELPNDKSDDEHGHKNEITEAKGDKEGYKDRFEQEFHYNVTNLGNVEDVGVSGDSDGCHDERADIATKKNAFLSSQCTFSQDSVDCKELDVCVKCYKVVHESCLGSHVSLSTRGEFLCPFCAYSKGILKYMDMKKKVSLARNDFATFVCLGARKELKKQPCRSYRLEQHHLEHDGSLHRSIETNDQDNAKHIDSLKHRRSLKHEEACCSSLKSGDISPFGGKTVDSTNDKPHNLERDKKDRKTMRQMPMSTGAHGQNEMAPSSVLRSKDGNASDNESQKKRESKSRVIIRSKNRVFRSPETHLVSECKSSPHIEAADHQKRSEENDFGISKYPMIVQKHKRQITHPEIPKLRRIRLPWTTAEEEKLKEGMLRFCSPHEKVTPWKKIMEFGADVFKKSRSTTDLKDKWRNICRGSPKS